MVSSDNLIYRLGRWPDDEVPADFPVWCYYELSRKADAVLRTVELFADGRIERDSIEIEQRHGYDCPSLIESSLNVAFEDANLEEISCGTFEEVWGRGVDTPFWFDR